MGGTYAAAGSFAAMSVMQGITFAGAALNLVGNVSGNKTLQKIGMVAGIAGGIGQLAGIQGPTLGKVFGSGGATPVTGAAPSGSLTNTPTSAANAPAAGNVQPAQSYAGGQVGTTTVAPTSAPAPVTTPPVTTPVNASPGFTAGSSYTGAYTPPDMSIATSDVLKTAGAGGGGVWESVKGAGKSLMDFTKENPGAAVMLGSTASTLSDYLTGKTDAEIDALEAQKSLAGAKSEEIQEAINRERQRRKNLEEGYAQVDTGIKVNPNASMQSAGLIAQQMSQA
jgi:hypothetical protein